MSLQKKTTLPFDHTTCMNLGHLNWRDICEGRVGDGYAITPPPAVFKNPNEERPFVVKKKSTPLGKIETKVTI